MRWSFFYVCVLKQEGKSRSKKLYENVMYGLYGNNRPSGSYGPSDLNGPLGWEYFGSIF